MLVTDGKVHRDLGRVLYAKEWREADDISAEEANNDKDYDNGDKGRGPAGVPLEYYNDFADLDGVEVATTIVLRDGDGGMDYGSAPPSAAGSSNGDGADVRGETDSQGN